MADKLDLVKKDKAYYSAGKKPEVLSFKAASYLAIEGEGEPGGKEFVEKVEGLYPLAYGVKKLCKTSGKDFAVPKLEGLWWVAGKKSALETPRNQWKWKLLIRMPDFVSESIVKKAQSEVSKKKGNDLINKIKFEKMTEGKCAQVLHVGSYADEPKTITELLCFISGQGFRANGLHHEIYLSDPSRTEPDKLKTIIRYPIQ